MGDIDDADGLLISFLSYFGSMRIGGRFEMRDADMICVLRADSRGWLRHFRGASMLMPIFDIITMMMHMTLNLRYIHDIASTSATCTQVR